MRANCPEQIQRPGFLGVGSSLERDVKAVRTKAPGSFAQDARICGQAAEIARPREFRQDVTRACGALVRPSERGAPFVLIGARSPAMLRRPDLRV